MTDKPKLCAAVEKFQERQDKLKEFGASDSEANWGFSNLMTRAIKGAPWVDAGPEYWQLYSSVAGWKRAAMSLTAAAKKVYTKVQKAPLVEAQAVAKWYGW